MPRSSCGRLVAILLGLKAMVLVFNAATYTSNRQYDPSHHAWRARSAGLEMGKMAYNSPLYYLPLLPFVDLSRFYQGGQPLLEVPTTKEEARQNLQLLDRLRWLNVAYVMGAYLVWICGILPMLTPSRKSWLLGSLLLLALPGIQKAAVMAHPDLLLFFLAPLTFYLSIRWLSGPPRFRRNLMLAALAGLTGACRPFAVVPMLICWSLNVGSLLRPWLAARFPERFQALPSAVAPAVAPAPHAAGRPGGLWRLGGKLLTISLITASLCSGWWAFRYAHTGHLMNAYADGYVARYQPVKANFDFGHYYGSFYLKSLLKVPSRADIGNKPSSAHMKNNSFWTQLYSELWGDHYLYFSGAKNGVESKLWVKRGLFVVALPMSLLLALGIVTGTLRAAQSALRRRVLLDPTLFMAATFWLGFGLFMYWQGTAGLLPGKNSTIKFLYIAWLVPFAVGTAAAQRISARWFWIVLTCELAVLLFAFPMSQYWR
jgi:hypothetical protein